MRYNGNKFSVYESEEKTVLGLLDELGSQVNHNTDNLNSKTDLYGDHKGSWQGLNRPTLSEEGMRATVEDIIDNKIPSIHSSLEHNDQQINDICVNTRDYEHLVIDNDYALAINGAINDVKDVGGKVLIARREVTIKSSIIVPQKVTLSGVGSGENPSLSKTTIYKNFKGVAIKVTGRNVKLEDFLLMQHTNNTCDNNDGILIGEGTTINGGRCIINNVIVNGMGKNGITLAYGNGCEINAKVYYNKQNGFSIEPSNSPDVSGCQLRIDAYGNEKIGVNLNNCSGNVLSVLSQSNKVSGVHCRGWGNVIQGYSEYNGTQGILIDGNASGNMVNIVSFGETPIIYNKGQLRTNNFIFIQNGDYTKGGYFRTSRIGIDNVSNLLNDVDSKTSGDLINTSNGNEPTGKGLYKYDSAYGWLRLDGVTFRAAPGSPTKGMDIHDTGDSRRKYWDGEKWYIMSRFVSVPSAWNSDGKQGDWSADGSYLYICQANNSWRRVALTTW